MSTYKLNEISVLAVDDSLYMRRIYAAILKGLGIDQIVEAENGEAAFEALIEKGADLVIADILMEPGDGIALTRRIRRDPKSPDKRTPVLIVSGLGDRKTVLEARDAGASRFLVKPISVATLTHAIETLIEDPRDFIDCDAYTGPDRRHHVSDDYAGLERRQGSGDDLSAALDPEPEEQADPSDMPVAG